MRLGVRWQLHDKSKYFPVLVIHLETIMVKQRLNMISDHPHLSLTKCVTINENTDILTIKAVNNERNNDLCTYVVPNRKQVCINFSVEKVTQTLWM